MSNHGALPADLGVQLVGILYKNTTLNFDVCAMNLVEIFQHLSTSVPNLDSISAHVITSIQNSISDEQVNPDLSVLDSDLKELSELSNTLQCGELNFYECNETIEASTERCIQLLTNQTQANVFNDVLRNNRDRILSLFGIWQLASNKNIKNNIIQLFNICAQTDPIIMRILCDSTNLASELCCSIKQDIQLADHLSLNRSCRCLITLVTYNPRMQLSFVDFLQTDDFLKTVFDAIESEKDYLYLNIYNKDNFDKNQKQTILEMFIHLLLAVNKKFMLPGENLILEFINSDSETISNRKFLSEAIVNLFNLDTDPLLNYQIGDDLTSALNLNDETYYVNSILKFVSDLFSSSVTKYTTSIFYSNDFNVLIDIILRKLACLGPDDQIRVDYLSLIELIIRNSEYMESMYRKSDLMDCFNAILGESDSETIDQDIVKIILKDYPMLKG